MRRRGSIAALGASRGRSRRRPSSMRCRSRSGQPRVGGSFADNMRAFHKGLGEAGYVEGRNVLIEHHWLEGRHDHKAMLYGPLNFEYSMQKLRISGPTSNGN